MPIASDGFTYIGWGNANHLMEWYRRPKPCRRDDGFEILRLPSVIAASDAQVEEGDWMKMLVAVEGLIKLAQECTNMTGSDDGTITDDDLSL